MRKTLARTFTFWSEKRKPSHNDDSRSYDTVQHSEHRKSGRRLCSKDGLRKASRAMGTLKRQ